jgi:hypothetical protein
MPTVAKRFEWAAGSLNKRGGFYYVPYIMPLLLKVNGAMKAE